MHDTAMTFLEQNMNRWRDAHVSVVRNTLNEVKAWSGTTRIVEFGAQDINGTARSLLPAQGVEYVGVDIVEADGVTVVMDAAAVTPDHVGGLCHVVVCTNVFEHVQDWPALVRAAYNILRPDGQLWVQCGGPGFQVHSGRTETLELEPGEWYGNVAHTALEAVMKDVGFRIVRTHWREQWPHDTTGVGTK